MRESILSGRIARAGATLFLLAVWGPVLAGQPPPASADRRPAEAARALSAGDPARARQVATAYLNAHPADPAVRVILARVHLAEGRLDDAFLEVRRAVAADPRHVDALYYQARITARLAEREFRRLEETAPGSARLHQLRAESLEAQDRRDAAEAEYDAALAARPDLLDALLALAKLKRVRLACEEATALYRRAEAIRPTVDGAYGLGVCESVLQNDEAAAAHFERALQRDPGSVVALVGLGKTLLRLRRPADAIARLQRAVAIEPSMAEAHYALGQAYQAAGDRERSAAAFRKAAELAEPR